MKANLPQLRRAAEILQDLMLDRVAQSAKRGNIHEVISRARGLKAHTAFRDIVDGATDSSEALSALFKRAYDLSALDLLQVLFDYADDMAD